MVTRSVLPPVSEAAVDEMKTNAPLVLAGMAQATRGLALRRHA